MSVEHNTLTGTSLHVPFNYIQDSDPGAVGAGAWWADTINKQVKQRNAGDTGWDNYSGSSGGSGTKPAVVVDSKSAGTDGGAYPTVRTWQTRVLNSVASDIDSIVTSLSSNQITLPAGTYYVEITAPCFGMDRNKIRLRNITDSTTVVVGTSSTPSTVATAKGVFTISGSKAFSLQHWGVVAPNQTYDLGLASIGSAVNSGEVEIYGAVTIWKL